MKNDLFASTDEIISRLFDPRCKNKYVSQSAKYLYLQHFLLVKWPEICGPGLARSCSPERLEGNELHIRTANSLMANELYMMQELFKQKINAFLLGRAVVKKLYFHSGSALRRRSETPPAGEGGQKLPEYTTCPACGSRMLEGQEKCSVCRREEREQLRRNLAELLRIQPWLSYKDCLLYYPCDKILFTAVRDSLKNYYFEQVRNGYANKRESLLAVLFLTEKPPQEITPELYGNALEYLRRNQSVFAFGSRLYGKKQRDNRHL